LPGLMLIIAVKVQERMHFVDFPISNGAKPTQIQRLQKSWLKRKL